MDQKINDLAPIWKIPDDNSDFNSRMTMKCHTTF